MQMYQARFILETMAILFDKRRTIIDTLEDMTLRLEELEAVLEDIMISSGHAVSGKESPSAWWDHPSFKIGLDADGACDCDKQTCKCDPSYRMD